MSERMPPMGGPENPNYGDPAKEAVIDFGFNAGGPKPGVIINVRKGLALERNASEEDTTILDNALEIVERLRKERGESSQDIPNPGFCALCGAELPRVTFPINFCGACGGKLN